MPSLLLHETVTCHNTPFVRRVMKLGFFFLTAVALLTWNGAAEARSHVHRYGFCSGHLHYDYTRSDFLGPLTYVYPVANWGPFFQCHMYRGPVIDYLPLYPW
jgi:hypothetical protein